METYEHPAPRAFLDAPRYFRRVWDTKDIPFEEVRSGVTFITPQFDNLAIYGYSTASSYAEDAASEARLYRERRVFPSVNFSVQCPEGEYGHVPLDAAEEITEEEFNAAREQGWKG